MPDSLTDDVLWLVGNRQLRRTFARSSPRRRRASTAFRCCRTPPTALGVGEGDTVRAVPLAPRRSR